jgi:hypothetical protein
MPGPRTFAPGRYQRAANAEHAQRRRQMPDVILIALGLVFFALSVGYAYACDRL